MAQEIERKFLVAHDGWRALATGSAQLEQFYLFSREGASARVRIRDGGAARLTIKTGRDGLSRRGPSLPNPNPNPTAFTLPRAVDRTIRGL